MSLTAVAASLSLIASGLPLLLIARRDPKRLRSVAASALLPHGTRTRQALALASLLPGVALMTLGYWPAFLLWIGGITVAGWLFAQYLAARP